MNMRMLGKSGIEISTILMGTWQAGKDMWTGISDAESKKAMQAAVEAGINAFDTAEYYGHGHSEKIVGEALSHLRDKVVLATKVFPSNLSYQQVLRACEGSLRNLKTDRIDLYQIHWPAGSFGTERVPIEETMRALNHLKDQGKIRAIGVSNFSNGQLAEAMQYGRIDSLQPPYSLFWRQLDADARPYCEEHEVTILAYSPLAQGILAGKFGPKPIFEDGDHRKANKLFQPEHYARVQAALDRLRPIAAKMGCTLAQLALAWLIAQPLSCAIAGARNAAQIQDTAKAMELTLSPGDLVEIDAIGKTVTDHLDDNPVLWSW